MNRCQNLIMSENARDFIIRYNSETYRQIKSMSDTCIQCVDETWCLAHTAGDDDMSRFIAEKGYYSVPKLYGLMQTDTSNFDESGLTATLNQTNLNVRGQGVIIGFIDTGIDYTLDIFQSARNISKITAIWDQTIQDNFNNEENMNGQEPQDNDYSYLTALGRFNYGTVYENEDINRALQAKVLGENPFDYVPTTDDNGHGTFIAGIAAGAQTREFTGAAPDAEIVMVKLKPAKQYLRNYYIIKDNVEAYQETDIMAGVRFLRFCALRENKPLVICLGVGTGSGPRTGMTPLADMLNSMAGRNNVVVVVPIGNEGNARTHVQDVLVSNTGVSEININVGENVKGFSMEIWADTLELLSVSFVSPSGQLIPRVPVRVGQSSVFRFLLENTTVSVDYKVAETVSGYEVIFIRFASPSQGVWGVNVYSLTNITAVYNAWLTLEQFLAGEVFFVKSNPDVTLTEPSPAFYMISVGAYNHVTGGIAIDSGRGYTADNRVKPDITAPGVNVYGPRVGGGYTTRSGTSIAAAHTAGAAALLLTWGVYYGNDVMMTTNKVKTILIRGAKRDANMEYPNNVWGYGKLNVLESFLQLRLS